MIAGSETTSNFLTIMLLSVFEHPEIAKKLKDEIDSVITSNADITLENMKKLKYLECVMSESQRVHSVAGGLFNRRLEEDTTMFGIPLSKGFYMGAFWVAALHNP